MRVLTGNSLKSVTYHLRKNTNYKYKYTKPVFDLHVVAFKICLTDQFLVKANEVFTSLMLSAWPSSVLRAPAPEIVSLKKGTTRHSSKGTFGDI